ncbi:MAG: hypothetical protein JSU77_08260 [Fidelibacterota bacterium]|nr:MAG: hypothetical protein JSU77_08260 [Candidatus Neomarinimicrobiota bacterium]
MNFLKQIGFFEIIKAESVADALKKLGRRSFAAFRSWRPSRSLNTFRMSRLGLNLPLEWKTRT